MVKVRYKSIFALCRTFIRQFMSYEKYITFIKSLKISLTDVNKYSTFIKNKKREFLFSKYVFCAANIAKRVSESENPSKR